MPFVITHWINLLAMFFLALSGFYIHYPIVPGLMGLARGTHFFWMFVLHHQPHRTSGHDVLRQGRQHAGHARSR